MSSSVTCLNQEIYTPHHAYGCRLRIGLSGVRPGWLVNALSLEQRHLPLRDRPVRAGDHISKFLKIEMLHKLEYSHFSLRRF